MKKAGFCDKERCKKWQLDFGGNIETTGEWNLFLNGINILNKNINRFYLFYNFIY